ncbi:hypothetical protein LDHU3_26.2500:CDS1 [Leishmania donovani]|nr:hypothetical protein LDHU3_26.2500:CDS1 [Leishmania donovani]
MGFYKNSHPSTSVSTNMPSNGEGTL